MHSVLCIYNNRMAQCMAKSLTVNIGINGFFRIIPLCTIQFVMDIPSGRYNAIQIANEPDKKSLHSRYQYMYNIKIILILNKFQIENSFLPYFHRFRTYLHTCARITQGLWRKVSIATIIRQCVILMKENASNRMHGNWIWLLVADCEQMLKLSDLFKIVNVLQPLDSWIISKCWHKASLNKRHIILFSPKGQ